MAKLRVVHHLNQFFAGEGGEEKANIPAGTKKGPVGPGAALQAALKDKGEVVATVYAGDNYVAEHPEEAVPKIVELIKGFKPDVVVSGPAFGAGRYGLNCGAICAMVQDKLGIPAIAGLYEENPAVELYKSRLYIAQTKETAAGMNEAVVVMARLAVKLANKEALGTPQEDGYIPTGRRVHQFSQRTAAQRAIEMLLKKARGEKYVTEWPLPKYYKVPPAHAMKDIAHKKVAIVTTSGVVPKGNPDKLQAAWATKWLKYNIYETNDLTSDLWQTIHGGFDTTNVNEDPDRAVPVDAMRDLEKEGVIGELHDFFYSTVGGMLSIPAARKYGQEIAKELKASGVEGVVLTGT